MHRQVISSLWGFLPVTFSASGRHAPYESSHGRTGTVTQGLPRHASRPLPAAACGDPVGEIWYCGRILLLESDGFRCAGFCCYPSGWRGGIKKRVQKSSKSFSDLLLAYAAVMGGTYLIFSFPIL